jgi:hypothetical protein
VERQNLTMRMHMRRFTRLTNAFSKKIENHAAAVALHFMYYNFCRVHQTLRVTPAMEAGISAHVWSLGRPPPSRARWRSCNGDCHTDASGGLFRLVPHYGSRLSDRKSQ